MNPRIMAEFRKLTDAPDLLALAETIESFKDLELERGGALGADEWIADSERMQLGLPDHIRDYAKIMLGVTAATFEELPRNQLRARLRAFARVALRVELALEKQYASRN